MTIVGRHTLPFFVLVFSVLGVAVATSSAPAEPLPGQEGLPPELTIAAAPPLAEQIKVLVQLTAYAAENAPEGGFIAGFKRFFSGSQQPPLVSISDLAAAVGEIKGKQVAVEGIYEAHGDNGAVFRSEGATCELALAGGTIPMGFPESGPDGLPARAEGTVEISEQGHPLIRVQKLTPALVLSYIRLGRAYELSENYRQALESYETGAKVGAVQRYMLAAFARCHAAELALKKLGDQKKAKGLYSTAWNEFTKEKPNGESLYYTWTSAGEGSAWQKRAVREVIVQPLNELQRDGIWYRLVDVFVQITGGNPAFGVLLLALVTRLAIYPLTKKQLGSARAMQKLQPRIKELQKQYKDNKQKFQEEFWRLCKDNKVNPLGGCLPLLIQMPILIMIYQGIRAYVVQFDQASFLWVKNLAQPDMPLLIAYTISMIAFQKMTQKMNPAAQIDPQQAQQQQMMTYLMPVMFFFLFQSFPAAFILYWLGTNLVYFGEQYWYMRGASEQPDEQHAPEKQPQGRPAASKAKPIPSAGKSAADSGRPQSYEERKAAAVGKKIRRDTQSQKGKKRR